ncbi:maltotransferase domain-containing protein, partial [Streptomyces lacrimifluminis]
MPATHHSSPPPTPTSGTPPIPPPEAAVPPATPETPSPAPETSPAARSTAPEQPSDPGPAARETPLAKGGPAPVTPSVKGEPTTDKPNPVKHSVTGEPTPAAPPAISGQSASNAPTSPAPPATKPAPAPRSGPPRPARTGNAVGRIPVLDVRPLVTGGRRPAKAVVGEAFEVSATVFREGHDAVAANVVLRDPKGRAGRWTPMRELAPGTDRWGATVEADAPGDWTYTVEAWGDPISTWRHHAGIKIPAGIDTELVLEEGALLYERAAAGVPKNKGKRDVLLAAAEALRDVERPAPARLSAALTPAVNKVLRRYPLRELVTSSEPLALV